MPRIGLLIALLALACGNNARLLAQSPKFVELVESDKPYQGKVVARSANKVWLLDRSGRLHTLNTADISKFRKLSDVFTPLSVGDARDQLRRELGGGFEIVGTGHYLVAGPPGLVRDYADVFEDQYRAVYTHFSVRGLEVHPPEFSLVAIIFPDAGSFARYAAKDKVTARTGLKGYYIQSTNRVALYHEDASKQASLRPAERLADGQFSGIDAANGRAKLLPSRLVSDAAQTKRLGGSLALPTSTVIFETPQTVGRESFMALRVGEDRTPLSLAAKPSPDFGCLSAHASWGNTDGDLQSTMIHEATHQVAFNIGIHQRVGSINPRWVVEGLATAFETPGMRSTSLANTPGAKLNEMRLTGFREFVKLRRQPKSLESYVQSDLVFGQNLLDGYAQAWALSFFLIETRPSEYARYIKLVAAHPPLEPYDDEQRLADFKSAFGSDLTLFEAKFLRYIAEVK